MPQSGPLRTMSSPARGSVRDWERLDIRSFISVVPIIIEMLSLRRLANLRIIGDLFETDADGRVPFKHKTLPPAPKLTAD